LVVEYKGSYLVTAAEAKEKQQVGYLWADRSKGQTLFLMIQNREFGRIDRASEMTWREKTLVFLLVEIFFAYFCHFYINGL
jgi:hypothetical protein